MSFLNIRNECHSLIKLYFICVTYGLPYFSFRFVSLRFFLFFSFSFVSFLFSLFCFRFFAFCFFSFLFVTFLLVFFSFFFFPFLFVSFRFFPFLSLQVPKFMMLNCPKEIKRKSLTHISLIFSRRCTTYCTSFTLYGLSVNWTIQGSFHDKGQKWPRKVSAAHKIIKHWFYFYFLGSPNEVFVIVLCNNMYLQIFSSNTFEFSIHGYRIYLHVKEMYWKFSVTVNVRFTPLSETKFISH